jgi:Glycosyl hydrolase family 9
VRVQVGTVQEKWGGPHPGDFDCYRRAENIPSAPNCPITTRTTTIAKSGLGASDAAAEAAAALAVAAALFAGDTPVKASYYMTSAKALFNFAETYPETATKRSFVVGFTYDTQFSETNRLWASSVLAWVHNCDRKSWNKQTRFCDRGEAGNYIGKAWYYWSSESVRARGEICCVLFVLCCATGRLVRHRLHLRLSACALACQSSTSCWHSAVANPAPPVQTQKQLAIPVANWNNAVYDAAFMMDLVTGNQLFADTLKTYLNRYIEANGQMQIRCAAAATASPTP